MSAEHQYQQPESDEALALGTEPIPAGPYYRDDYFELGCARQLSSRRRIGSSSRRTRHGAVSPFTAPDGRYRFFADDRVPRAQCGENSIQRPSYANGFATAVVFGVVGSQYLSDCKISFKLNCTNLINDFY